MEMKIYVIPLKRETWGVSSREVRTVFDFDYAAGREKLLNLCQKRKDLQWNSSYRIDWNLEIDLDNPLGVPDQFVPIYGSGVWDRLTPREEANVRRHVAPWQFSQFLHGEQGALICAAKIVRPYR